MDMLIALIYLLRNWQLQKYPRSKNLHRKCGISVQQCVGRFHGERPVFRGNKHHGNKSAALLAIYTKQPQQSLQHHSSCGNIYNKLQDINIYNNEKTNLNKKIFYK